MTYYKKAPIFNKRNSKGLPGLVSVIGNWSLEFIPTKRAGQVLKFDQYNLEISELHIIISKIIL